MATTERQGALEPAAFPGAFAYEHTDIPPGMTIAAYRRERATQHERIAVRRLTRQRDVVGVISAALGAVRPRPRTRRVEAAR